MELLIIRHALPVRRELDAGIADPQLSEDGLAQAERLAEYLASEKIHAVYASPLRRAQQTAGPLARSQGVDIVTVDDVAEWDRNSNEYVPVEELKPRTIRAGRPCFGVSGMSTRKAPKNSTNDVFWRSKE